MRVTAQTKSATRKRILRAARRLFADNGYDAATTRDIALAAEAIGDALTEAGGPGAHPADTLEEDLFALIAAGLRKLKPLRKHLPSLLETSLSPLAATPQHDDSASFRVAQMEAVAARAARHGFGELPPTALQLYWTLYTGVLAFWANDASARQEDTLALINDSLDMFVAWLREQTKARPGGA